MQSRDRRSMLYVHARGAATGNDGRQDYVGAVSWTDRARGLVCGGCNAVAVGGRGAAAANGRGPTGALAGTSGRPTGRRGQGRAGRGVARQSRPGARPHEGRAAGAGAAGPAGVGQAQGRRSQGAVRRRAQGAGQITGGPGGEGVGAVRAGAVGAGAEAVRQRDSGVPEDGGRLRGRGRARRRRLFGRGESRLPDRHGAACRRSSRRGRRHVEALRARAPRLLLGAPRAGAAGQARRRSASLCSARVWGARSGPPRRVADPRWAKVSRPSPRRLRVWETIRSGRGARSGDRPQHGHRRPHPRPDLRPQSVGRGACGTRGPRVNRPPCHTSSPSFCQPCFCPQPFRFVQGPRGAGQVRPLRHHLRRAEEGGGAVRRRRAGQVRQAEGVAPSPR